MESAQPSETEARKKANELLQYHEVIGYPSGYGGAPPSVSHAGAGYAGYSPHAMPPQVIIQAPQPLSDPPNSYLGFSIFNTLCCCFILGVVAIINSVQSRASARYGKLLEHSLIS
ncbi:hypothetical protein EB796_016928 [Bugula neritina]|uniref:Uncharacterized protein n=1 Tax=Bugula neritina TaxID=10212 RepID=A0A7J7JHB8_BUGNE|nr:hypothetical protein EB796_016928 [Bugula neritina]